MMTLATKPCISCDWVSAQSDVLYFSMKLWEKWVYATKVYPDLELLALFKVNKSREITELVFPEQEIAVADCLLKEQKGQWDGMIHSHHTMSAKFSSMDYDTVLPNYKFAIVTNHMGNIEATEQVDLPCGGKGYKKINIIISPAFVDSEQIRSVILRTVSVKPQTTFAYERIEDYSFPQNHDVPWKNDLFDSYTEKSNIPDQVVNLAEHLLYDKQHKINKYIAVLSKLSDNSLTGIQLSLMASTTDNQLILDKLEDIDCINNINGYTYITESGLDLLDYLSSTTI